MTLRFILAVFVLGASLQVRAGKWEREHKLMAYFRCGTSFNLYLSHILNHESPEKEVVLASDNFSTPGFQKILFNYRWYSNNNEYLYQLLKKTPMDGSVPSSYEENQTKFKDYFVSSATTGEVPKKDREKFLNEMMTLIEHDLIIGLQSVSLAALKETVQSNRVNRAHLAVSGKGALLLRESACDVIQEIEFKKAYRAAGDLLVEAFRVPGDPRPGIEDQRPGF